MANRSLYHEYEQHGSNWAKYGDQLIESLSGDLTRQLGKGFSAREIWKWSAYL
ncbi:MAG: hypothetical protein HY731_03775 [Candidatus Tectomicrobia bacterium]|nr:hypothetical protein [Candidatus Tectomicrobia bacterium]